MKIHGEPSKLQYTSFGHAKARSSSLDKNPEIYCTKSIEQLSGCKTHLKNHLAHRPTKCCFVVRAGARVWCMLDFVVELCTAGQYIQGAFVRIHGKVHREGDSSNPAHVIMQALKEVISIP